MGSLRHGVTFEATKPVLELTGWLEDNCEGDWSVEVDAEYTVGAKIKVFFESLKDRRSFAKNFA